MSNQEQYEQALYQLKEALIDCCNASLREENARLRALIVTLRTDCDCEPAHEACRRALEGERGKR